MAYLRTRKPMIRSVSPSARAAFAQLPRADFSASTINSHSTRFNASSSVPRWLVPLNLVVALGASVLLARAISFFAFVATVQLLFYAVAVLSLLGHIKGRLARVAGYFTIANAAIAVAGWKYTRGVRVEVWAPSRRP